MLNRIANAKYLPPIVGRKPGPGSEASVELVEGDCMMTGYPAGRRLNLDTEVIHAIAGPDEPVAWIARDGIDAIRSLEGGCFVGGGGSSWSRRRKGPGNGGGSARGRTYGRRRGAGHSAGRPGMLNSFPRASTTDGFGLEEDEELG